jgi:Spherulation-specific family 4
MDFPRVSVSLGGTRIFPEADAPSPLRLVRAQSLAIPAYFPPGPSWDRMIAAHPTAGLAVMNPMNGPGTTKSAEYQITIGRCRDAGLQVLGYIFTDYSHRDEKNITDEIEQYESWYGVDGIFFDEASSNCSDRPYYEKLRDAAEARSQNPLIVLNPGESTCMCYMSVADIVVTFEGSYIEYLTSYTASDWVNKYDSKRFWHLVNGVQSGAQLERSIRLSRRRGAGWVYVTPDGLPNPWGRLPAEVYWCAELSAMQAQNL